MINNFDTFPFEFVPGEFYFIQIINRQKSGTNNKSRCIKSYFVRDQEHLDKKMDEMIKIADTTSSRIYMHPSRRSERKISLELLTYTADCIKYNEIGRLWRGYETVCGRDHGVEKIRLVDVDTKDQQIVEEVVQHIKSLRPYREPRIINETVNGYHILYKGGFDSSQYKLGWDIHKNNPTLLYYDDSVEQLQGRYDRLIERKHIEPSIEPIKITKSERKQFPLISKALDAINKEITGSQQDDATLS